MPILWSGLEERTPFSYIYWGTIWKLGNTPVKIEKWWKVVCILYSFLLPETKFISLNSNVTNESLLTQSVRISVQGTVRVVRGCGYVENDPPRNEELCMKRSGTHDVQILYCACKGDLCNSVPALTRPSVTVALAVSAIAMLAKTLLL